MAHERTYPNEMTTTARMSPIGERVRSIFAGKLVQDLAISLLSIAVMAGLWYFGTLFLSPNILPAPHLVAAALVGHLVDGSIWGDIAITLWRILLAFVLAMGVSLLLGFSMAMSRFAGVFFRVWITCGLTIPALVTMLTMYMIVGLNDQAAILGAALPVIPILTINVREGVKGIDLRLMAMAKAFRASRRQQIMSVIVPQVAPMLLASSRFGLGLVWKMVLFVELLGRGNGIGYKIEFYYQMFNMTEVLAHALSFLLIMLFIELVILGVIEKRIFKWRDR